MKRGIVKVFISFFMVPRRSSKFKDFKLLPAIPFNHKFNAITIGWVEMKNQWNSFTQWNRLSHFREYKHFAILAS